jgi:hypothetical protein
MKLKPRHVPIALLIGVVCGVFLSSIWNGRALPAAHAEDTNAQAPTLASLAAEIETIKGRLPDQAHAMADVGYQFSNLWSARQKANWLLADFYWKETKSHLNWAVRIIPKRKDSAGQEIDLVAILQALENSPLKELGDAIASKNQAEFDKAYRSTLEGCYACHKASDKPFLRPHIPRQPDASIINFDLNADWPK